MAYFGPNTVAFSGETTEFDDVLMKHGVITKEQALVAKGMPLDQVADILVKDKLEEMGFFEEPDVPEPSKSDVAASANLDELDELEEDEDFSDESFLAKYREARLAELKAQKSTEVFSSVTDITKKDWIREVNEASKAHWVLCHLYEDHVEACEVMHGIFDRFAAKFRSVKCLRIKSKSAVENYPPSRLPALFAYRDGELQHQLITLDEMYGMRSRDEDLEWWLAAKTVVSTDLDCRPAPPTTVVNRIGIGSSGGLTAASKAAERRDRERRFVGKDNGDESGSDNDDIDEYGNGSRRET